MESGKLKWDDCNYIQHKMFADENMLRDWFAGQALVGIVADMTGLAKRVGRAYRYDEVANYAYTFADAMMKARRKA